MDATTIQEGVRKNFLYFQWEHIVHENDTKFFSKSAKIIKPVIFPGEIRWPTLTAPMFREILPYFEKGVPRERVTKKMLKDFKEKDFYAEVGKVAADANRWDLVLELATYFGEKTYVAR
jgi:hypothetical protein